LARLFNSWQTLVVTGKVWDGRSTVGCVSHELEDLEQIMDQLRADVRRAKIGGDHVRARELRAELRKAERRWGDAVDKLGDGPLSAASSDEPAPGTPPNTALHSEALPASASRAGSRAGALPAREQVHQVLTLLGTPAAPRLIVSVHGAFYAGPAASSRLASSRLTSLRRDEERSFRAAPYARPYYLCATLTADLLSPVRGLIAVSTWPMDLRIIGPLSPRVDYLTAAIAVAQRLERINSPDLAARRLLWRFAANIPQAATTMRTMTPAEVAAAARNELAVHQDADSAHRAAAAVRARAQLDDAAQLFGSVLGLRQHASHGT
jgi:hypothetical protein